VHCKGEVRGRDNLLLMALEKIVVETDARKAPKSITFV